MGTYEDRLVTGLIGPVFNSYYPDFPRNDTGEIWFEGTNILTTSYIQNNTRVNNKTRLGMIVADFPGPGLIERVINSNFDLVTIHSKLDNNKVLDVNNIEMYFLLKSIR